MFIEFHGAAKDGEGGYAERGPVWVNVDRISVWYDHRILIDGHSIFVMETGDEIKHLISGLDPYDDDGR